MQPQQFTSIRKKSGKTQEELGKYLEPMLSRSTIQNLEGGRKAIPQEIEEQMLALEAELIRVAKENESEVMDVSKLKTLTIDEMLAFQLKHKEKFLSRPVMKVIIDAAKDAGKIELLKNHIIQTAMQEENKKKK